MDKIKLMGLLAFRSNADPKLILETFKEYAYYKVSNNEELQLINTLTKVPMDPENVDTLIVYMERITGLSVNDSVVNKLRAYANLTSNDKVVQQWQLFEKISNALMDGVFDAEHIDPPSDIELVYTGYIFKRDASEQKHKISNEVKTYVKTLWQKEYGFVEPHPWLTDFWPLPNTSNTILVHQKHDEYVLKFRDIKEITIDELLANSTSPIDTQAMRMALLSLEVQHLINH